MTGGFIGKEPSEEVQKEAKDILTTTKGWTVVKEVTTELCYIINLMEDATWRLRRDKSTKLSMADANPIDHTLVEYCRLVPAGTK